MKESDWIPSSLPIGWILTKNKSLISVKNGFPCPSEGFNTDKRGIPVIRIRDITAGSTNTWFEGAYPEELMIKNGDLLVGMDGDFNIRLWDAGDALLNQRCCKIECHDEYVKKYLFYILPFQLKAINALKNSTTVKHLNNEDILNATLPIPKNRATLIQVVDNLTNVCTKIEQQILCLRQIVEKTNEYRQSLITHAVTKGLDSDIGMKDSELPWLGYIPEHWSCMRLAHCFSSVNRPADLDLPVLSVSIHTGISDTELNDEDRERKVWLSEDRSKYQGINTGDLVYNMMRAWQGAFGTCTRTGLVSPAYTVLVPKKGILSKYYELLFRTPNAKHLIYGYSQGIADFRKRLYWEKARDIYVPVPPFEEQIQIADECDFIDKRIDDLKKEISKQIDLLNEYKSALISSAFMGGN